MYLNVNGRCACLQVIPPGWLKLFNTQEVNQLLGGGESGAMDISDMAAHAQYSGGYSKDHPTVKIFWKVRCWSCWELCRLPLRP